MDGLLSDIPEWWLLTLAVAALLLTMVLAAAESALQRIGRTALSELQVAERSRADAVEHLADLGHREIRHVAGPVGSMDATERMRGWRIALGERGLRVHEPLFHLPPVPAEGKGRTDREPFRGRGGNGDRDAADAVGRLLELEGVPACPGLLDVA